MENLSAEHRAIYDSLSAAATAQHESATREIKDLLAQSMDSIRSSVNKGVTDMRVYADGIESSLHQSMDELRAQMGLAAPEEDPQFRTSASDAETGPDGRHAASITRRPVVRASGPYIPPPARVMASGGWRNYGKKAPVVEKPKNKWEVPEIPSWEQLQYRKRYAEATRKIEEEKAEWKRERERRSREEAHKVFKKMMDDYHLKRKKMIEDDKKAKEWELKREMDRLAKEKAAKEDAKKRKGKYGRCTQ